MPGGLWDLIAERKEGLRGGKKDLIADRAAIEASSFAPQERRRCAVYRVVEGRDPGGGGRARAALVTAVGPVDAARTRHFVTLDRGETLPVRDVRGLGMVGRRWW